MRRLRTWLIVTAIFVIIFVVWDLHNDSQLEDKVPETSTTAGSEVFKEFCQFLENDLVGSEGEAPAEFTLVGLVLAFRHGERSPVVQLRRDVVHPDCSAFFDVDRRSFDAYQQLIESPDFKHFLKLDERFKKFPMLPERSRCQLGRMTAEGALQLVKLGNFLRSKYSAVGLFTDLAKEDVYLISSMYPRTFQSAIAFTSAFFFPSSKQTIPTLLLNSSKNTFFCTTNTCSCPALRNLRIEHEMQRSEHYYNRAPEKLQRRLMELSELLGVKVLEHPLEFVDAVLGRYACRRLPLPCNKHGNCVTLEDFQQSHDEGREIVTRLTEPANLTSTARRLFVAEAYSILMDLHSTVEQLGTKTANKKQIRVFSGHDVTLWPLVFVLGLGGEEDLNIVYSSRIAFEIYKSKSADTFFRMVVNGVDKTPKIGFCQPLTQGLCSASKLGNFLKTDFFPLAGVTTLQELCAP